MTPKRGKSSKRQIVLVFGENENDTKVIAELLVALCPELDGMVKPRRKPPILMRDCDASKLPDRTQMIRQLRCREDIARSPVRVRT